jgi:CDP-glycerol glycerophosphotransferase (TagB/SpsB family)
MRRCALNTGHDFHLLDHIAPLAHSLKMPLITEEEKNFTLIQHYYPMVSASYREIDLKYLAENFDELYECKFWKPHLKQLFKDLYHKEMRLVFCAHGQSDKGYGAPLLHPYAIQDSCLIYGELLQEMLCDLNISAQCKRTGNYRLSFYLEYKRFYDDLTQKEIFSRFPNRQFTILYAPTWNDADGSSSFFRTIDNLCEKLPDSINLIVKVHPLLEQRNPSQFYRLEHLLEQKTNCLLVHEFPPVYPLLSGVDAYLGDYSSVGYDFLYFKKPMFFLLNHKLPLGKIHNCGRSLERIEDLFKYTTNPFAKEQEALYRKAFF